MPHSVKFDAASSAAGELEELRGVNADLRRELSELRDGHRNVLEAMLVCEGLLHKFSSMKVRKDFVLGKLGVNNANDQILLSIDIIAEILLPSPGLWKADSGGIDRVSFMSRFLSRDESGEPEFEGSPLPYRQNFSWWRDLFQQLVQSDYWPSQCSAGGSPTGKVLKSEVHCKGGDYNHVGGNPTTVDGTGHLEVNCGEVKDSEVCDSHQPDTMSAGGRYSSSSEYCEYGSSLKSGPKSRVKGKSSVPSVSDSTSDSRDEYSGKRRFSRSSGARREYRHMCSSSSSSTDSSDSSGESMIAPSDRGKLSNSRKSESALLRDTLLEVRRGKEVVSPGVYDPDSGLSFRKFLRDYERYFNAKFTGNDRDRSRHLREFLDGTLRQTYDAVDGSEVKYRHLKPQLLEANGAHRTNRKERKFEEFMKAGLGPGERLYVYCLRLEQLAFKAFPSSDAERLRQLKRKFKSTAPRSFLVKLDAVHDTLAVMGKPKMGWNDMKRLAEEMDRDGRDRYVRSTPVVSHEETDVVPEVKVWYNRSDQITPSPSATASKRVFDTPVTRGARPRVFVQSGKSGNNRVTLFCAWCGKSGHTEDRCWLKSGACLACGGQDHASHECPRRNSQSRLVCSLCQGDHLGKDCPLHAASN